MKKSSKISVKRVLYVDSAEDFDANNLGVHFTRNLYYNHTGGGDGFQTVIRQYKITVFVTVDRSQVNWDATEFSNEYHPNESEVVLNFNQDFDAEIWIAKKDDDGFGFGRPERKFITVNTGTRCDAWVLTV